MKSMSFGGVSRFKNIRPSFTVKRLVKRCGLSALVGIGFACMTVVACAAPQTESKPLAPPTNIEELKARIEKVLQDTNTPGVGIAIVRKDGPEWIGGIGLADVANKKSVTEDTMFRIGSTSKMFVALSVLKLQHQGKLDLQDTLKSRVPDLPFENRWEATDPLRIVHLLEHTAGWDDMALKEYVFDAGNEVTVKDGLDFNPKTRTSRWKPGTRMSYTNIGPPAAAYVVEKVSGQRFEDYVEQNWFRPLRMMTASYFDTADVRSRITQSYGRDGKTLRPYSRILVRPSGAINASPKEMANLVQFYLNRGTFEGVELLPAAAIDRMERAASTYSARDGLEVGYGLNNYVSIKGGRFWHGHGGAIDGCLTDLSYQLDSGAGYVFTINAMNGRAMGQISGLLQAYLTRSLPQPLIPAPAKISEAVVREIAGWYEPINPRNENMHFLERLLGLTRMTGTSAEIRMKPLLGKKQVYVAVNDRLFRREKEPVARLALISDHSEGTLAQIDGFATFRKVSAWIVYAEFLVVVLGMPLALSSVVFALVWVPRKVFGRMKMVKHFSVRALPLLSILSTVVVVVTVQLSSSDALLRLGHVTPWSITICLASGASALFAVLGLVQALRHRGSEMRRLVWWHSFLVSLFLTIIAAYFAYWGMFGYRTWA